MDFLEWRLLRWMSKPFNKDEKPNYPHNFPTWDGKRFYPYDNDIAKPARVLAARWVKLGWLVDDGSGSFVLSATKVAEGRAAHAQPLWNPPAPALTEFDYEVLCELHVQTKRHLGKPIPQDVQDWAAPMHCGGTNGSGHSASLAKLTHHGYAYLWRWKDGAVTGVTGGAAVPFPAVFKRGKGSRHYLITEAGAKVLGAREVAQKATRS